MPVHLTEDGFLVPTLSEEEAKPEDAELVRSFEEWERRAGSWPLKRLVAIWNNLPGVVPVQKFTSRDIALERIWRSLHPRESGRHQKTREQRRIPFREGSKAAQVYALLCRPQGATAHELQELTGWQRHSVRGFLSASLRKQGQFREAIRTLGLPYVVGIMSWLSVWKPGEAPLSKPKWKGMGRPTKLLRRDSRHQPMAVKDLAHRLPASTWKTVTWRQGTKQSLRSRFAAVRIRLAHRDYWRSEPHPEECLLVEWPGGEAEPTKYWLSTLPADAKLSDLVRLAKQRWIIERDYQELKQELGLGHFEGRGWRGFHHHATLCIAAYGFLVAERGRFSPSARAGKLQLRAPRLPVDFKPRGSPRPGRAA